MKRGEAKKVLALISQSTLRKKKHSPSSLNSLETNHAGSEKLEFTEEEKQIMAASTLVN